MRGFAVIVLILLGIVAAPSFLGADQKADPLGGLLMKAHGK